MSRAGAHGFHGWFVGCASCVIQGRGASKMSEMNETGLEWGGKGWEMRSVAAQERRGRGRSGFSMHFFNGLPGDVIKCITKNDSRRVWQPGSYLDRN